MGLTPPELYVQHSDFFVTRWRYNAARFKSTAMYQIETESVIHFQDDTKTTKPFSCPELESKKKGHYVAEDLVIFPFAWLLTPNPCCGGPCLTQH